MARGQIERMKNLAKAIWKEWRNIACEHLSSLTFIRPSIAGEKNANPCVAPTRYFAESFPFQDILGAGLCEFNLQLED